MNPKAAFESLKSRLHSFRVDRLSNGAESFSLSLSEEDLLADLSRTEGNNRLLGRFSEEDVRVALSDYGVWKALEEKGYAEPQLVIRSTDPFRQTLKIFTEPDAPEDEDHLLCELRVFDAHLSGPCPLTGKTFEVDALVIDWLNFQNPRAAFTREKPRLPGQVHPGLGILRLSMHAILDLAKQTGKEAVINIPEYYHNAVLYHPAFRFFSAYVQGRFLALMKVLMHLSLAEGSHAVSRQKVLYGMDAGPFIWKPHEQVLGLVPRISEYFTSELYAQKCREAEAASGFKLTESGQA